MVNTACKTACEKLQFSYDQQSVCWIHIVMTVTSGGLKVLTAAHTLGSGRAPWGRSG